jgi:hypothetical protein
MIRHRIVIGQLLQVCRRHAIYFIGANSNFPRSHAFRPVELVMLIIRKQLKPTQGTGALLLEPLDDAGLVKDVPTGQPHHIRLADRMREEADAALAIALIDEILLGHSDASEVVNGELGGGRTAALHHLVALHLKLEVLCKLRRDGLTEEGLEEPLEGVEVGLELVDFVHFLRVAGAPHGSAASAAEGEGVGLLTVADEGCDVEDAVAVAGSRSDGGGVGSWSVADVSPVHDATRKTSSELHLLRTVALLLSGGEESAFFEAAASV